MPMPHYLITTPTIIEDCQSGESGRAVTIRTEATEYIEHIGHDPVAAAFSPLLDSAPERRAFSSYYPQVFSTKEWMVPIDAKYIEGFGRGYGIGAVYTKPGLYSYTAGFVQQSPLGWLESFHRDQWGGQIKGAVTSLLESGDAEEEVAPEAVEYACQLIDRLPSECFLLPPPDVSGFADKKAVYFEWMLKTDGRMLLTVEPDGTVCLCLHIWERSVQKPRGLGRPHCRFNAPLFCQTRTAT